jgi:predicted nucleotide-binding protein
MSKEQSNSLPRLTVPIQKAREQINVQIEKGSEIRDRDIKSEDDLTKARRDRNKWDDFNNTLLKGIFSNESIANEYNEILGRVYRSSSLSEYIEDFRYDLYNDITRLESILEKLELISEPEGKSNEPIMNTTSKSSIFIVHGADSVRYELKDLLKEWGLNPIILDEQASLGRTIIEKFEDHSSEAECAIILLTPDDEGRRKDTAEWKPRARQNVIFEHGYFVGRLGRDKVICLHKSDIELPSDISGIIYTPFINNLKDEIYRKLRTELKAMGLTIKD